MSALTRVLFWYLFPSLLRNSGNKHQNNPLVSAETVRHSSTYIILYIYYDGYIHTLYIRCATIWMRVHQLSCLRFTRNDGCLSLHSIWLCHTINRFTKSKLIEKNNLNIKLFFKWLSLFTWSLCHLNVTRKVICQLPTSRAVYSINST